MAQRLTHRWQTEQDLERWTRRHVVRTGAGLALRRGITVADEAGRCNNRDVERVAGGRQARKTFVLDALACARAKVCAYVSREGGDGDLEVVVNGHVTTLPWTESREYWVDSWRAVDIDGAWLQTGANEVLFRATGTSSWALIVEESVQPDRSAVSDDGGRTWRTEELGVNDRADGEYLVRLWLDQHHPRGEVCSDVVDLLDVDGGGIARRGRAAAVRVELDGRQPAGTSRRLEWRAGATPAYTPGGWSAWEALGADGAEVAPQVRFFQWRALLATHDPALTPTVTGATLTAQVATETAPVATETASVARVTAADNRPLVYGSYGFSHLPADDRRGRILRERWKLDQVVGPAKSQFEAFTRLRQWTREQWEDGWNMGPLSYVPPWDALVILELAGQQLSLGMCTHYASVFTQCCAALGFTARTQVMRGHCITEVWSNDYGKWVTMDPGGDNKDDTKYTYHFERDGVPLSALEAHTAWVRRQLDGIALSPPPPAAAAQRFTVAGRILHWERFMFNRRNDETATLGPGEPEHGAGSYHFDGYLFWEDELTPPLPWFTRHTDRAGDLYWDVDRTRIHLQAAGAALHVDLEGVAPNHERFEVRVDGGGWEPRVAAFAWSLHPGENRLEARTVNAHGRAGIASAVTVVA